MAGAQGVRAYRGLYANGQYEFSFQVPPGLTCFGADAEAPAHGCVIRDGADSISVNGSYATLFESAREAVDFYVTTGRTHRQGFTVVSRTGDTVQVRWTENGQPRVGRFQARYRTGEIGIIYEIVADCSAANAARCEERFAAVSRSFTLTGTTSPSSNRR